jgi:hypothetical protein
LLLLLLLLHCLPPAALQRLCDWIDDNKKSCTAFDFPTKGILQVGVMWRALLL